MPKKGLGLDGGREKGGLIRVTGHFRNLLSSSPPPSSYRMPGRIIDKIALREDFDPWLPNIEKISTMRWLKEFLDNCLLFSLGENLAIVVSTDRLLLTFEYNLRAASICPALRRGEGCKGPLILGPFFSAVPPHTRQRPQTHPSPVCILAQPDTFSKRRRRRSRASSF